MRTIPKAFKDRLAEATGGGNNWMPQNPGDSIVGYVVGWGKQETRFSRKASKNGKEGKRIGDAADIIILEGDGGIRMNVLASTVIRSELERQGGWMKTGYLLGIKFLGMQKNYRRFAVVVEGLAKAAAAK